MKASGFKEPNEEAKEAINKSKEERRELKGFADMQKLFEDLVN